MCVCGGALSPGSVPFSGHSLSPFQSRKRIRGGWVPYVCRGAGHGSGWRGRACVHKRGWHACEYVIGLEFHVALHANLAGFRLVHPMCSAVNVEAHPSCLTSPPIELGVSWVVNPGFLPPFTGGCKVRLKSGECLVWGRLIQGFGQCPVL